MSDHGMNTLSEDLLHALLERGIGKDDALQAFRRLDADAQAALVARLQRHPALADGRDVATGRLEALRQRVLADLEALCEELD